MRDVLDIERIKELAVFIYVCRRIRIGDGVIGESGSNFNLFLFHNIPETEKILL